MQKRFIGLSLCSCSLCILQTFVDVPLFVCVTFFPLTNARTWVFVLYVFHSMLIHGVLYLSCIRFFMFYFDIHWTAITVSTPAHWIIHVRKPSSKSKARDQLWRTLQAADPSDPSAHFNSLSHPNPDTITLHNRITSEVEENWFIKHKQPYGS
eukprot:355164_1